jgi:hypothetical protein
MTSSTAHTLSFCYIKKEKPLESQTSTDDKNRLKEHKKRHVSIGIRINIHASGAVCGCPPRIRTSRKLDHGRMRRSACRRLLFADVCGSPHVPARPNYNAIGFSLQRARFQRCVLHRPGAVLHPGAHGERVARMCASRLLLVPRPSATRVLLPVARRPLVRPRRALDLPSS